MEATTSAVPAGREGRAAGVPRHIAAGYLRAFPKRRRHHDHDA